MHLARLMLSWWNSYGRTRLACRLYALLALAALLVLAIPAPELEEKYSFSQRVLDDQGQLLRLTLSDDDKYRLRVPLNDISAVMREATLLYEDRFFYRHYGINPVAIFKAGWQTYVRGGERVGASTITMQLARLLYDIDSHRLPGKLYQIFRALQLELSYSKEEILRAYFNLAPYGGNIEGIAAASHIYFDKTPDKLTLHEAMLLAVIPQSPARRNLDKGNDTPGLVAARDELIARWLEYHPHAANETAELLRLPVQARKRRDLPFRAPHFVEQVLRQEHQQDVPTPLNLEIQQMIERLASSYVESQRDKGIKNVSVMLLDWRDMSVKAMLGSVDYFNAEIQGQVNGTDALRSPGSLLKPFVYALAMDQGLMHPRTMLKDSPTAYGGFNPENYDKDFVGPVSVEDALIHSRNIPAVNTAARLDQTDLYDFLQSARVPLLKDKKWYGLSIVLGTAEITMQSLMKLYAMLANEGMINELRLTTHMQNQSDWRMLSDAASHLTLNILANNPRPDLRHRREWLSNPPVVAWKTGTSWSFRDAWSMGIVGPYVLGVWVGNFNGENNRHFVGRTAAGPLFFNIVDALHVRDPDLNHYRGDPPNSVKQVEVCAVSGQIPGPACPNTRKTGFIRGASPITKCQVHRHIAIDRQTGLRACTLDAPNSRRAAWEFWPSDLRAVFRQAGLPRRLPPPYLPSCGKAAYLTDGVVPTISSPYENVLYVVRGKKEDRQIPFTAVTDGDVRELHWFIDNEYLGKTRSDKPMYWNPAPGHYNVRVVDDHGRSSSRDLRVEWNT